MLPNSVLHLNGHTFTSGIIGLGPFGSRGPADFTIVGPGVISGFNDETNWGAESICVLFYTGRLVVDGSAGEVVIQGCEYAIAADYTGRSRITVDNLTVLRGPSVPFAAIQGGRIEATNLTIDFIGYFQEPPRRPYGILAARTLEGSNISVNAAGNALDGRKVRVRDVTVTHSFTAVANARLADVTNLTSTTNHNGVFGRVVRLTDSELATFDPVNNFDVASKARPVLVNTTCRRSMIFTAPSAYPFGGTWGVCSLD
jgi:hypothetical protein